ncbi:SurA N-terminal domain-containing protein [Legionella fairfieldensis]|uniref:SurA N-terminal domain-containing protein n=1 Tax=Legionella fairfieldensis TaxID=45064 RepID=UPI00048F76A3|nr:SurA N-terminal domain-containing protein [Legionella fairfieldensis]
MLQKLNERIQGVIAWVVIILIAVTFTLFGVDYYMQGHQTSNVEVDVNGQPISKQDVEINYKRARQQRESSQITAVNEAVLKKQVLDNMIANEVSVQAANATGFDVSYAQANAAIRSIPQFQQDGHFSLERYQQALSGAMFTPESFQREVKQGMLLNQQRFAFIGSAFALPGEIKRFVKLYMQTRDYDYLTIPSDLFMKENKISDEMIKKYYQNHQKEFVSPEQVSIDYVRLSMQHIKEKVQVSEEDIKRYYDENQSNFLTPAQWQVAHILFAVPEDASVETETQIKKRAEDTYQILQNNPAQFNELVKSASDDKLSVANNGILPWLTAGQSGFDKTLINLTTPEQIAPPVKSSHGYEIFKLIAYKPALIKPLSEVKEEIKEQLLTELAQAKYARALEQLNDLSYQSPDSLEPVANTLKLPIEKTGLFSRKGNNVEPINNRQVVNAAFSHDVLSFGNNSDPVQMDNDSVLVLRVNQHIPAAERPLAEVQEEITKKLATQNAKNAARQFGAELLGTQADSALQKKLIQEKQLRWQSVENASRDTDKAEAIVNDLAFNLTQTNNIDGRELNNGDYVIVRLKKIHNGQFELLDKEQQASLTQQIETNYGTMDYDLYINNLIAKAKINKP